MASRLTPTRILTTCAVALPALLLSKHAWDVYTKVSPTPRRQITTVEGAPDSLHASWTVRNLVNPRGHTTTSDSLFIDIDIPEHARKLSDEALLAAFVRGFFGGKVFAMERGLLDLFRADFAATKFTAIEKTTEPAAAVWETKLLDGDVLPARNTRLFSAFQVVDSDLVPSQSLPDGVKNSETASTVDIVFGSDTHQFSGVHRFSIIRDQQKPEKVRIDCAHVTCNPTINKPLTPRALFVFHKMYSMLLFRESIGEVVRRIEAEGR